MTSTIEQHRALRPSRRPRLPRLPRVARTRPAGVALAAVTACVSGVSVFVNGYGVRRVPDATTYTTAKNLVAAVLLLCATLLAAAARRSDGGFTAPARRRDWMGLAVIAVVGGSVPFVLFFEGLARAGSRDAAFVQKTLVVWVALLAVPLLRERLGAAHVAAIGLLVVGQALLAKDLTTVRPDAGVLMVLAATLLWAVEVVVAKRMLTEMSSLTVGTARMAGGVVLLLAWSVARGRAGALAGLDRTQWVWVLVTGGLLFVYVVTWYAALARAQAVDVTAVLVFGAVITALLERAVHGSAVVDPAGLVLITAGTAFVAIASRRRPTLAGVPAP